MKKLMITVVALSMCGCGTLTTLFDHDGLETNHDLKQRLYQESDEGVGMKTPPTVSRPVEMPGISAIDRDLRSEFVTQLFGGRDTESVIKNATTAEVYGLDSLGQPAGSPTNLDKHEVQALTTILLEPSSLTLLGFRGQTAALSQQLSKQ